MKRLPNVSTVIEHVKTRADACRTEQMQKVAEENRPSFSVALADQLYKLAQQMRNVKTAEVTMDDVHNFVNQLKGRI